MAAKKNSKKKSSSKHLSAQQQVGIGVGLTAAAVAAAGTYFLYGSKNAAENRKKVRSWALKAKAEVLEKLEDAREMTKEEYEQLVDTVAGLYSTARNVSKSDIVAFRKEMKDHWKMIEKEAGTVKKAIKSASTKAKKTAKKVAPKPAKKTAKKPAKKASKKTAKKATKKAATKKGKKK